MLSELHHGESTVTAALWLFCSCTIAVGGLVSALLGTLEFLGIAGRTGPRTWTSLAPWLLFVGAAVLMSIEYRWWRWLVSRGTHGRHRR